MLLTYYMWIKAVKTGSIYWAAMCALAYFYMVSLPSPGAEVFLTPRTARDTVTENNVACRSCVLVFRELEPLRRAWPENGTGAFFIRLRLPKLAGFLCQVLLPALKNLGFWQR